jgi:hypothetical protein
MHCAVRELEAGLEDISLSQQYSNRGIYILCKVSPVLCEVIREPIKRLA